MFLFVDIVIILTWSVVDPLRKDEKFLTNEVLYTSNIYDLIYERVYEKRESSRSVGRWAVDLLLEYCWTAVNCVVIRSSQSLASD